MRNRRTVHRLSIVISGALAFWWSVFGAMSTDSIAGPADSEINRPMSEIGSGPAGEQTARSGLDNTPEGGTLPGGTVPGGTVPGGTLPGGTIPGGTLPNKTLPGGTVPGGTLPGGTLPGGTVPGGTVPSKKLPGEGR